MSFRPQNDKFVPDPRCDGWFMVHIVNYSIDDSRIVKRTEYAVQEIVDNDFNALMNVYCPYRVYTPDSGDLIMSVREEDIGHLCDALYTFRLERPRAEHLLPTVEWTENNPYLKAFLPELKSLLHNYEIKKTIESTDQNPQAVIKRNYVLDMVNVLAQRLIIDYQTQQNCDDFVRLLASELITKPCKCKIDCSWRCFKNIWSFQTAVDQKYKRSTSEKEKLFGSMCNMTKKQFKRRLILNKEGFVKQLRENLTITELDPGFDKLHGKRDNQPETINEEIQHRRGLFLSSSTTYANWQGEPEAKETETSSSQDESSIDTGVELSFEEVECS